MGITKKNPGDTTTPEARANQSDESDETDEPDDLTILASDLRMTCQRLARQVRFENTGDVAPHQMGVLMRLARLGAQTPTQLADHERVSTPSMTRTLNCLADKGLVARSPHPDDRRQVLVDVTPGGRRLAQRTAAARDTWMMRRLAPLDAEQRDLLRRATDLLIAFVDSEPRR